MSTPRTVEIELPEGCLGGWPVLLDALARARFQTGLTLTFGDLINQIKRQTEPRPEEPTGLGAVVEDTEGNRYIRTEDVADRPWRRWPGITSGWDYITAVRVLSKGVTP